MTTPTPASDRRGLRRARRVSGRTLLIVFGAFVDTYAVVNVPGAATLVPVDGGEEVRATSFVAPLVLLAIAAWISLIWVDRVPLLPLIAGGVLAVIGISYLLLLVAAVRVVRMRPRMLRTVGILVACGVILFAAREAFAPWGLALPWMFSSSIAVDDPAWVWGPFVVAAISLGIATAVVVVARSRAQVDRSEQRVVIATQQADAFREQTVRQAERERIARDMHDALAHRLSVVSLHAGALETVAGTGDASEMARTVREQTHAALQDMRGLIGELRSDPAASAAPVTMRAIGSLIADARTRGQSVTSLILIESPERAGAMLDGAVFRIVQESLTNAMKHAAGSHIDVYVAVTPADGCRVRVVNTLGMASGGTVPGGGNGVLGIRERAAMLGGEAWIGAHDGTYIVDVTLPWQERG
ncbi:sensor histidine kinase [Microbacterium sp. ZW T5_45]|uniref:sensor histidine kinase n=1 Tax=Microbacterium sp. ZW T5_45 TaxID=3378080 RepID=UPI003851B845